MQRILVVAAHPDDEVLGCGATMARHAANGDQVTILILGEGLTARDEERRPESSRDQLRALKEDAARSARIMGVSDLRCLGFPDNRFDTVPLLDIVKSVEKVKTDVHPSVVYTHHAGDLNIDHRIVFQAVLIACRPQPNETVQTIYSFEVPSSTEWQASMVHPFMPTVYVDATATLGKKLDAMAAYGSELREFPHPRSLRALEVLARKNGVEAGLEAAERFALIRTIVRDHRPAG